MNPILVNGSFDPQIAPKRSNSGREILYFQNQRVIGSQQTVHDFVPAAAPAAATAHLHAIPQDVMEAFDRLRHYSYRELYHYLKLVRQNELKHSSLRTSSIPEHRVPNPRLSISSQASSAGSSIFSTNPHRMSMASTNTAYSHFSDPGVVHGGFGYAMNQQHTASGAEMDLSLNRKKSSASMMVNSPSKTPSNRSTLTAPLPRPSPRQSQSELEAKKKYFCTSCNKGFARKYDWKVHEQRYHEQQKQYPCPDCNVVLHAETLFKSHHRDAHGCQDCVHAKVQEREVEDRRRRTAWGCGFCGELLDDWEKRCDHVSAHYDEGVKRDSWDHSKVIVGLLKQDDIDEQWRTLLILKHGQLPNPPLSMRWSKEATGRSHGENSTQLQDLLEFGAAERDATLVAQMAYDLGLRSNLDSPPSPTRQASETSSSSGVKSESKSTEPHDSIMASPMNMTPDMPYQPINQNVGNYNDFDPSGGMEQHHDPRMSTMDPTSMGVWTTNFADPNMMMSQQHFHQQVEQPMHAMSQTMQNPYADKALPPIPGGAAEMVIPMHIQSDANAIAYDGWNLNASLMGTSIAEDPMLTAATYAPQHYS